MFTPCFQLVFIDTSMMDTEIFRVEQDYRSSRNEEETEGFGKRIEEKLKIYTYGNFSKETKVVRIKSRRFKRARLTFPRRKMDWDMNFEKRNHGHCLPWKFYLWPTDPHRTCARPHSIPADLSISLKFKSGYQMGQLVYSKARISRKFLENFETSFRFCTRRRIARKGNFRNFHEVEVEEAYCFATVLTTVLAL